MMFVYYIFLACILAVNAIGEDDLVKNVPGLLFKTNFKVYSGYLNGNANGTWKMHYMLTESRNDPTNDPLLFWFNGGPGCSSFSGSFEELGPFYINKDGQTLFENVYSWNARANVLYLESPIGVGFSYDTSNPHYYHADDDQTLGQNYQALLDFFTRVQTKYQGKDFYLSGESYAGIYLPMLGAKIAENKATFPANLKGIAIGNGFMHVKMLTNSLILWSNYHGRISLDDWNTLKSFKCCNATSADDCDWTPYLTTKNKIDYVANLNTECGQILDPIINATGLYNIDPYNYYEDCYAGSFITYYGKPKRHDYLKWKEARDTTGNTADQINRDSTDPLLGYPCWQEDYVAVYFNNQTVQDAFNIDPAWRAANLTFGDCNTDLYNSYVLTYDNMKPNFDKMINLLDNFRILVYNGDVDTVCNFLGDAKFIDGVASSNGLKVTSDKRQQWYFRQNVAGFVQRYEGGKNFSIDVLTVKGAGHMVPLDRPGPSVQMISNFIMDPKPNYNSEKYVNPAPTPAPLLGVTNPTQSTAGVSSTAQTQVPADGSSTAQTQVTADGSSTAQTQVPADGSSTAQTQVTADGSSTAQTQVTADGSSTAQTQAPVDGSSTTQTGATIQTSPLLSTSIIAFICSLFINRIL